VYHPTLFDDPLWGISLNNCTNCKCQTLETLGYISAATANSIHLSIYFHAAGSQATAYMGQRR